MPFDIEDFGVVLSAGLTCPKHMWSFDLFTGKSDRGGYKLGVWEVQVCDEKGERVLENKASAAQDGGCTVWVRRKQRFG